MKLKPICVRISDGLYHGPIFLKGGSKDRRKKFRRIKRQNPDSLRRKSAWEYTEKGTRVHVRQKP